MITIGIRATPRTVTFAIFDSEAEAVLNVEEIRIPAALSTPVGLKYVRSTILDILREYKVSSAGIRTTEPSSQQLNIARIQIEGVIQESFASSELDSYYVGNIASISKRIGIDRKQFKPLADGIDNIGIENWSNMTKEQREAVLCAMGACDA